MFVHDVVLVILLVWYSLVCSLVKIRPENMLQSVFQFVRVPKTFFQSELCLVWSGKWCDLTKNFYISLIQECNMVTTDIAEYEVFLVRCYVHALLSE